MDKLIELTQKLADVMRLAGNLGCSIYNDFDEMVIYFPDSTDFFRFFPFDKYKDQYEVEEDCMPSGSFMGTRFTLHMHGIRIFTVEYEEETW